MVGSSAGEGRLGSRPLERRAVVGRSRGGPFFLALLAARVHISPGFLVSPSSLRPLPSLLIKPRGPQNNGVKCSSGPAPRCVKLDFRASLPSGDPWAGLSGTLPTSSAKASRSAGLGTGMKWDRISQPRILGATR